MIDVELLLAQALCGGPRNPCRYHIAGAKAVLNALAGADLVIVSFDLALSEAADPAAAQPAAAE